MSNRRKFVYRQFPFKVEDSQILNRNSAQLWAALSQRKRRTRPGDVTRSPLLGEHTDEIPRQVLGFSDHQVAEIHDSGALDPPRKQAAE